MSCGENSEVGFFRTVIMTTLERMRRSDVLLAPPK